MFKMQKLVGFHYNSEVLIKVCWLQMIDNTYFGLLDKEIKYSGK